MEMLVQNMYVGGEYACAAQVVRPGGFAERCVM